MMQEEYSNADGSITVDYVKGHIKEEMTNKIWCHPHYELMVIIKGDITYNDTKGVTKVGDRSVVFIKAHEVHNPFVHYSSLYERYRVRFFADFATDVLKDGIEIKKEISESYKKRLSDSDFAEILTCVKTLFDEVKAGKDKSNKLRESICLISALLKGSDALPGVDEFEKNYIAEVIEFIKANYSAHLTAENLAARFFVSRGKLMYDFKAYCDMSLLEYITLTRLEAAKEMLLSGYSVSSASENCGFSSPSYFIKVFSGVVGMTPLKFQTNFLRNR